MSKASTSFADLLRPVAEVTRSLSTREAERYRAMHEEAAERGYAEGHAAGREQGYREGWQTAYEEARRQLLAEIAENEQRAEQAYVAALQAESEIVRRCVDDWYAAAEQSLGRLAILIAERIVLRELDEDREVLYRIAREALREVTNATRVRVRANPFHMEILRERKDRLKALQPLLEHIELVDDPTIMGGCVLESDGGVIDARIEIQLARLVEAARGE